MAKVSNTGYGGSTPEGYTGYLEYTINSTNSVTKQSNITLTLTSQSRSSTLNAWRSTATYSLKVDNVVKKSGTVNANHANRAVVTWGSWTGWVPHDSNGNLTINIKGEWYINTNSVTGCNISYNWTLPSLNTASTATFPDSTQNLGTTQRITIQSDSSSYHHSVYYYCGNKGFLVGENIYSWVDLTMPEHFISELANRVWLTGFVRVITYSGTTQIGRNDIPLAARVPNGGDYEPSITSFNWYPKGTGRDNALGIIVRAISVLVIDVESAPGLGATVASKVITVGSTLSAEGSTAEFGPFSSASSNVVTFTIIDSRGRTAVHTFTLPTYDYSNPEIRNFQATRLTGSSSNVIRFNRDIKWSNIVPTSSDPLNNKLDMRIDRRVTGSTGAWTLTNIETGFSGSATSNIEVNGISGLSSWDFRVTVTDQYNRSAVASITVGTALVPFSISKTGVGAGKIWESGPLDVGGDIRWEEVDGIPSSLRSTINGLYAGGSTSGTTTDGFWQRWESGLQICYVYKTFSGTAIGSASGTVFASNNITWAYPAAFTDRPYIYGVDNVTSEEAWMVVTTSGTSTANFKLYAGKTSTRASRPISMLAIGVWK